MPCSSISRALPPPPPNPSQFDAFFSGKALLWSFEPTSGHGLGGCCPIVACPKLVWCVGSGDEDLAGSRVDSLCTCTPRRSKVLGKVDNLATAAWSAETSSRRAVCWMLIVDWCWWDIRVFRSSILVIFTLLQKWSCMQAIWKPHFHAKVIINTLFVNILWYIRSVCKVLQMSWAAFINNGKLHKISQ